MTDEGSALADAAREGFRDALVRSHKARGNYEELDAAAARYCQVLRSQGCSPERALVNAKHVIAEAIDNDDRPVAERAVSTCIQEYFRT